MPVSRSSIMISLFRCELICKRGRLSCTPVVNASSQADCPRHMTDKIRNSIIIDRSVHKPYSCLMVRPREFDRDEALDRAARVFWAKGYAATSTEDLLAAMNIGRQSLYNAFGDKRKLYLEALQRYQRESNAGHLARLNSSASPLGGIEARLLGLISKDDSVRALGCMRVNAVSEFGAADPELVMFGSKVGPKLFSRMPERIRQGQADGEVDLSI